MIMMQINKMANGLYNGFGAGDPAAQARVVNKSAPIAAKYFFNDLSAGIFFNF